jgi:hypothetical protein
MCRSLILYKVLVFTIPCSTRLVFDAMQIPIPERRLLPLPDPDDSLGFVTTQTLILYMIG